MKPQEILTHDDNQTLCEIRVLGVFGVIAVVGAGFLALPALEIGAGVAAVLTALGGAIRLRGTD
jgi:hypothetical protein